MTSWPIEVIPDISNLAAMRAKGAGELKSDWTVSGGAVIKEVAPEKLLLRRSQCSGKIAVKLALSNGGADVTATAPILVTEPQRDAWVQRTPAQDEQPEENQFYGNPYKYDLEGYAQVARLISPLVEQDHYGLIPKQAITAPNLQRAWFTSTAKDEIALDFGQPMAWNDDAKKSFYLDGGAASIDSGSVSGSAITLKLTAPSSARVIGYLSGKDWDGAHQHLICGANGIAALTFCDVELAPSAR